MRRRDLLGLLASAALEAGVPRNRMTVIADEAGASPAEWIAFAGRHGLTHLEVRSVRVDGRSRMMDFMSPAELRPVAAQLRDAGLKVSFFNSALLKYTLPGTTAVRVEDFYENYYKERGWTSEGMYAERMERLRRAIAAAQTMGATRMRTFGFWRVANPRDVLPRVAEVIGGMCEVALQEGMELLVETEGSTNIGTSSEARDLLSMVPAKNAGINWDPQNSLRLEPDVFPAGYERLPHRRIRNVQIKSEGLFGDARLDWGGIIARMEKDGYRGLYGLETHVGGPGNYAMSERCMTEMQRIGASIGRGG